VTLLLALWPRLLMLASSLVAACEGTPLSRIHGDFHLGQVLLVQGDAYIIDFEGEPSRPLSARREITSPWRDVAGLLCSLDYAADFARKIGPSDLGGQADEQKQCLLDRLSPDCQQAFLQAYRGVASGTQPAQEATLLNLFTLEKAAYQVCYEAANRPGWLLAAINGMLQIAQGLLLPSSRGTKHD
jgi:maltose alpha-D-glucosyltransferase/alpha-amylase